MKSLTLNISLLFLSLTIFGQNDPQAITILDKFSATALSAPSVTMKFDFVASDLAEETEVTNSGSIIVSKDRYKLTMEDNIIWFNGKTIWNYLINEEEVTISEPDSDDDSFQNRPSAIFTMYKKGYKTRLVEESPDAYVIDLYPDDIKTNLIRVRITLVKPSLNLKSIGYRNRDGMEYLLKVKEYDLRQKPDPSLFTFVPSEYGDAEIIDMR